MKGISIQGVGKSFLICREMVQPVQVYLQSLPRREKLYSSTGRYRTVRVPVPFLPRSTGTGTIALSISITVSYSLLKIFIEREYILAL